MKIRSTECEHDFTKKLFKALGAYSIQGLTMSSEHNWIAAIEAIQYDSDETIDLISVFDIKDLRAKYSLAQIIKVPLYFLVYQNGLFIIFKVEKSNQNFVFVKENELDENEFINWWKSIKGTEQSKGLNNGAKPRAENTIFDDVLDKHHLAWGGNIDGFIFRRGKLVCIIENIYTKRHPLDTPEGEPSKYFFKQGPNYNTWYSSVKLANDLSVPLFLFTIDGNNKNDERIGFTTIDHLSAKGIFYKDGKFPNQNVIQGLSHIVEVVNSNLPTIPYIEQNGQ